MLNGPNHRGGAVVTPTAAATRTATPHRASAVVVGPGARPSHQQRVISLDFDGVLHPTAEGAQRIAVTHFAWLPILERILASHPQVMLLVHSTWRHRLDLDELRLLIGEVLGPRVVAAAPAGDHRWLAIQAWLATQTQVLDLFILDDAPQEFPATLPFTLIACDPATGLSDARVQQSIQRWLDRDQEWEPPK